MKKAMSMSRKLYLLIGAFAVGFALFGVVTYLTINKLDVHGPVYEKAFLNKDLIADIIPPPLFVVRPYALVYMMVNAETPEQYQGAKERFQSTEKDFRDRQAFWAKQMAEGDVKQQLTEDVEKPAEEFFAVVNQEVIPALDKGDRAAALQVVTTKVDPLYHKHRFAIEAMVKDVVHEGETLNAEAASSVSRQTWILTLIGIGCIATVAGLAWWIMRSIVAQNARDTENNAKLAAIGKSQAMIEFEMDGTIVTANDNFLSTLGYTLDEIKGRHHSLFVEEATRNSAEYREFWARLNRGENLPGEYRQIAKGGKLVIIQASYVPVPDQNGKLVKVVEFATDITQAALTRTEAARSGSMMEQAPINVMFADRDLKIRYVNPASVTTLRTIEHLLPVKVDQVLGQSIDIFHKRPEHQRKLLSDPTNLPHKAEIQVGPETLDLLASPIYDQNKNYLGAMVTWAIITKRLQMERDIKEASEREKQQAEEAKTKVDEILVVATSVAKGDYSREITVAGSDAIGQLGEGLSKFFKDKQVAEAKDRENVERDKQKAAEMARILELVNGSAQTLGSSAEELTAVSSQMASNAEETSAQANVVSAASEQVSKNVQVVSTGVEEMNSAIREIAKNATESARVAQQAVTTAEEANVTISKLGDSSAEIGNVIKVITSIAEQTNLLALNATIEAARAGEAGKGFAVVANEVKELAKETARATEDISRKIEAIQGDTRGAVESIKQIGQVIVQINDISNTIASAVEEQTATATEMSRNVSEAAKGTSEIAQNITAVAQAAQNTTQGASNAQQAASELARMAADLQKLGAGSGSSKTLAV
jgi:methyl-accepting chemotaxis protein